MARNDPPPPGAADEPSDSGEAGEPGPADGDGEETLRRLQERLDRASGTAERLIAEATAQSAARAASAFRRPPPAGWQAPKSEGGKRGRGGDLDALVQLLESLRDLIPPDLQQRIIEAVKELLQAIRALIDWYLERLEGHQEEPAEVQDIPINWD